MARPVHSSREPASAANCLRPKALRDIPVAEHGNPRDSVIVVRAAAIAEFSVQMSSFLRGEGSFLHDEGAGATLEATGRMDAP